MNTSKKMLKIILPVAIVLVVLLGVGLSVGLTYPLWSDTTGGDTSVAPSITTYDWNAYTKYFTYDAYNSSGVLIQSGLKNGGTITITNKGEPAYFVCTGLTNETLMGEVVFPSKVSYSFNSVVNQKDLTEISNTVFDDITYKAVPTKIVLSPTITKVRQNAFAGLTNLQSVLICADSASDVHGIRFGYHALGNCTSLEEIKCEGQLSVVFSDLVCGGCTSLTHLNKGTCNLFYIENIDSTLSATPITSSNWTSGNNYKSKIFAGAPIENPFS